MNGNINKSLQCLEVTERCPVCGVAFFPWNPHNANVLNVSRAETSRLWCKSNTFTWLTTRVFFLSLQPHCPPPRTCVSHTALTVASQYAPFSFSSGFLNVLWALLGPSSLLPCPPLLSIQLGCHLAYSPFGYQPRCHVLYKSFSALPKSAVNVLPEHALRALTCGTDYPSLPLDCEQPECCHTLLTFLSPELINVPGT